MAEGHGMTGLSRAASRHCPVRRPEKRSNHSVATEDVGHPSLSQSAFSTEPDSPWSAWPRDDARAPVYLGILPKANGISRLRTFPRLTLASPLDPRSVIPDPHPEFVVIRLGKYEPRQCTLLL